jgi:hypothetical protein
MQREMWWVCCQCKMKFNEHEDPNKCVYESESLRPLQNKVSNWTPHSSCYRSKESNRCCLSTVDFPFDVLHVETKFFAKDIREQHGSIRFAQTCPGDVRLRILVCVLQLWSDNLEWQQSDAFPMVKSQVSSFPQEEHNCAISFLPSWVPNMSPKINSSDCNILLSYAELWLHGDSLELGGCSPDVCDMAWSLKWFVYALCLSLSGSGFQCTKFMIRLSMTNAQTLWWP